jgi:hypothetical protein
MMPRRPPARIAVLLGVLLVASACTGGTAKKPPLSRPVGPILEMVVAASVDKAGRPVDPRFTFSPDQPKVTVIVQVGKVHSSPLDLTWFRLTEQGAQQLFRDRVQVGAWDRAWSVGKNPGRLAAGAYQVTATLEGRTGTLVWAVANRQAPQPQAQHAQQAAAQQGAAPVRGGSGTIPRPAGTPAGPAGSPRGRPGAGGSGCRAEVWGFDGLGKTTVETSADTIHIMSDKLGPACGGAVVEVSAALPGKPEGPVGSYDNAGGPMLFPKDPCTLRSGSDLPATRIVATARLSPRAGGTPAGPAAQATFVLGDDTLAPDVRVVSRPARGSKVKPGETITLDVTAMERRFYPWGPDPDFPPWQTGVKFIQVVRTDQAGAAQQLVKQSPVYGGAPRPCAQKSWEQHLHATYTVPPNPPAVIHLCALAEDYPGNQGVNCGVFHTGQTWQGTIHSVATVDTRLAGRHAHAAATYDTTLALAVAGDGTISGSGTAELVSGRCNLNGSDTTATEIRFTISGSAFGDRLELHWTFTGATPERGLACGFGIRFFQGALHRPLVVPVTGGGIAQGHATEHLQQSIVEYNVTHAVRLTCHGCARGG